MKRKNKEPAEFCGNMGTDRGRGVGLMRAAILLCAGTFILLGVMNEGARDVLYKAIAVCTECIGLG